MIKLDVCKAMSVSREHFFLYQLCNTKVFLFVLFKFIFTSFFIIALLTVVSIVIITTTRLRVDWKFTLSSSYGAISSFLTAF